MTIEERKARLRELLKLLATPVNIPFHGIHKDVEKVMGRSVHTHELASGVNQYLFDELDGKAVPGLIEKAFLIRGVEVLPRVD